jgi:2-methylcitrate dehydratase PrpD
MSSMHPAPLSVDLCSFVTTFPGGEIPDDVIGIARSCLIDAVACALQGRSLPWTGILEQHLKGVSREGLCRILPNDPALDSQHAALLWGSSCHAFELDNLRRPGAGVHPGACIALPALAVAIENGNTGRELLEAIVLATEGAFRIGLAAKHSSERLGFHAPGITGPFGSALAVSRLLKLDAIKASFALGICGSLAGGLLEFSQSNQGGMVKRLHMGRAAEAGVLAARLASGGYEGPQYIFEGRYGILNVFCQTSDADQILSELGGRWETRTMCFKRYPSHITTQAILEFLRLNGFPNPERARCIREMVLHVPHKVISHHAAVSPSDLMGAQYSVPFMAACGCFVDVGDPQNISENLLDDPDIRGLIARIRLQEIVEKGAESWDAGIEIRYDNGLDSIVGTQTGFPGSPLQPFTEGELRQKFMRLGASICSDGPQLEGLYQRLKDMGADEVVRI